MNRIDEIKARAEKATPGPWEWSSNAGEIWTFYKNKGGEVVATSTEGEGIAIGEEDAEFIAHAREDIPFLLSELENRDDDICKKQMTIDLLLAELERYQKWVKDLQSGVYVNCVYCGHRYGPSDKIPASMAEVLKQHIEQCPKHPMSALKKELEKVTAERDAAIDNLREAKDNLKYLAELNGMCECCMQKEKCKTGCIVYVALESRGPCEENGGEKK